MSISYSLVLLILLYATSAAAVHGTGERGLKLAIIFNCVVQGNLYEDGTIEILGFGRCEKEISDILKHTKPERRAF